MELTILMPCLNEAASVEYCVREALSYIYSRGLSGEVLVADNGSTDGSRELAAAAGARVISVVDRGYGHAILGGLKAARGQYVIFGDCDGSYDFSNLDPMLVCLRNGADLVAGDRYVGGIEKGAMPWSHRYVGVPLLSWLGRRRFRVEVKDFHCGLRGVNREAALKLELVCGGMEFATELIGRFAAAGLTIAQVGVPLRKDLRTGSGHLRTLPDGWRHLKLLLRWPQYEWI